MMLASKIKMYIPPRQRYGLSTYRFYINNIKYYEYVFNRGTIVLPPTDEEIYLSKDRVSFLLKFYDNEILRTGYKFSRRYTDRKEMVEKFIEENISIYGEFHLTSNSRKAYSSKAKVIMYIDPKGEQTFDTVEFSKLINIDNKCVNNPIGEIFSTLSLRSLRRRILEKFEQWRQRDGMFTALGHGDLQIILDKLEQIIKVEECNDSSAYLGTPTL